MDNKTNQELFKQALVEGVNRRLDREIANCDEPIVFSRRHIKNMARIVQGKSIKKPLNRKMIAILVAAAVLLLAGCVIIYRNEIREFVTYVREYFVKITFDEGDNNSQTIDEVYELTYVPDGYTFKQENNTRTRVQYLFTDINNNYIKFIQLPIDASSFSVDIEHGGYDVINVVEYKVYYRQTDGINYYLWNDGKYAIKLISTNQLSNEVLEWILMGIKIK